MSALSAAPRGDAVAPPAYDAAVPAARPRVLLALGLQEGLRLVRHPVFLAGYLLLVGITATMVLTDHVERWPGDDGFGPGDAFGAIDTAPTFFAGVFAVVAANLVASRDRRSRSGEMLAPAPVDVHLRNVALCLGALAPAALLLVHGLVARAVFDALDLFFVVPGLAHVLQAPVTVLGGALTGILVARWAPWTGAVVVAVVALIALNMWINPGDPVHASFGMVMSWARWAPEGMWAGLLPGSPAWHVVYLVGLCGCAASAALLRTAPRRLPVLVAGAAAGLLAVAGGIGQLP